MSERSRAVRRSFFARLAVVGSLLIIASIIVAGATGNVPGAFSFFPPALISLIVAVLLGIFGRGVIVALVISFLAFLLFAVLEVVGGLPALSHPESFSDFVPALLRAAGSVMAFTGTLVAFVQSRRGPEGLRGGNSTERRLVKAGSIGLVLLAVVSVVLTYTRNADIDAPPGASVVETLEDEFSPSEFSFEPGPHKILVVNRDSYAHTFSVDELELDVYIGPRADRLITFDVPDDPGRYDLYCAVTGHEDMTGTLEISG